MGVDFERSGVGGDPVRGHESTMREGIAELGCEDSLKVGSIYTEEIGFLPFWT